MFRDLGVLAVRLTLGVLMAGHGSQKLFGWFKGPGLKGTHGIMESLGMRPGKIWGSMAAFGEFSGGVLTALGLFHPVGLQNIASAMTVATRRAHWGKPIWASKGGAELPLTNLALAIALSTVDPGRFSLDRLFGIRLPKWLVVLSWLNVVAVTGAALFRPEVAQEAMDRIQGSAPASAPAHDNPASDIVAETRPRTESEEKQHTSV